MAPLVIGTHCTSASRSNGRFPGHQGQAEPAHQLGELLQRGAHVVHRFGHAGDGHRGVLELAFVFQGDLAAVRAQHSGQPSGVLLALAAPVGQHRLQDGQHAAVAEVAGGQAGGRVEQSALDLDADLLAAGGPERGAQVVPGQLPVGHAVPTRVAIRGWPARSSTAATASRADRAAPWHQAWAPEKVLAGEEDPRVVGRVRRAEHRQVAGVFAGCQVGEGAAAHAGLHVPVAVQDVVHVGGDAGVEPVQAVQHQGVAVRRGQRGEAPGVRAPLVGAEQGGRLGRAQRVSGGPAVVGAAVDAVGDRHGVVRRVPALLDRQVGEASAAVDAVLQFPAAAGEVEDRLAAAGVADAAHGVPLGVGQARTDGDLVECGRRDAADHVVGVVLQRGAEPLAVDPDAVRGEGEFVDPAGQPEGAGAQGPDEGVDQRFQPVHQLDLPLVEQSEVVDQDLQQGGLLVVGEPAGVADEVPGVLRQVLVDELPQGHRGRPLQRRVVPVAGQRVLLLLDGERAPHRAEQAVQHRRRGLPFARAERVRGVEDGHVLDPDPLAAQVVVGARVGVDERAGLQVELGDVVQHAVVVAGDAHGAEVDVGAVPEAVGPHPSAGPVRPFVDHDVEPAPLQLVRADQAGDSCADDGDPPSGARHRVQQGTRERKARIEHRHRTPLATGLRLSLVQAWFVCHSAAPTRVRGRCRTCRANVATRSAGAGLAEGPGK
ncbi:hypothetical protein KAURM247S_02189 [Kitasatospora aureofaciens]